MERSGKRWETGSEKDRQKCVMCERQTERNNNNVRSGKEMEEREWESEIKQEYREREKGNS